MNVFINSIHNSPKLETTQTSFNRWTIKQTLVHQYHGLINYKQNIYTQNNLGKSPENYNEKVKAKGYTLHGSIYISFLTQHMIEMEIDL